MLQKFGGKFLRERKIERQNLSYETLKTSLSSMLELEAYFMVFTNLKFKFEFNSILQN